MNTQAQLDKLYKEQSKLRKVNPCSIKIQLIQSRINQLLKLA